MHPRHARYEYTRPPLPIQAHLGRLAVLHSPKDIKGIFYRTITQNNSVILLPLLSIISLHHWPLPHLPVGVRAEAIEEPILSLRHHIHPRALFRDFPPLYKRISLVALPRMLCHDHLG